MNRNLLFGLTLLFIQLLPLPSYLNAQEIVVQEKNNFHDISAIHISGDFCSINIKGYEGDSVVYDGIIKTNENQESYKITTTVVDNVLTVEVSKPEKWSSHWGAINLLIPDGLAVSVNTMSGKVSIESLSECQIDIKSKSGHVNLTRIKGDVKSFSPAGDLIVEDFDGELVSKSKTGKVIVSNVNGNLDCSCDNGEFNVTNCKGTLKITGGSGSQVYENIEGDIAVKSTSGDIKLSLVKGNIVTRTFDGNQKLFQTEGAYQVQSSTGSITGNRVKFLSSSAITSTEGNIKMQMNTKSDLAFELKSDNSYLRAMGKSKKKSLKVGKGSILITGNSTSGSQTYY